MKEFLLILLFGRAMVLTPDPVSFHGAIVLVPTEPIEAVTAGASVLIDVSSMISERDKERLWFSDEVFLELFPVSSVHGKLIGREGTEVALEYTGGYSIGQDAIEMSLVARHGVPTGTKFNRVVVESKMKLVDVRVVWKNYKQ